MESNITVVRKHEHAFCHRKISVFIHSYICNIQKSPKTASSMEEDRDLEEGSSVYSRGKEWHQHFRNVWYFSKNVKHVRTLRPSSLILLSLVWDSFLRSLVSIRRLAGRFAKHGYWALPQSFGITEVWAGTWELAFLRSFQARRCCGSGDLSMSTTAVKATLVLTCKRVHKN